MDKLIYFSIYNNRIIKNGKRIYCKVLEWRADKNNYKPIEVKDLGEVLKEECIDILKIETGKTIQALGEDVLKIKFPHMEKIMVCDDGDFIGEYFLSNILSNKNITNNLSIVYSQRQWYNKSDGSKYSPNFNVESELLKDNYNIRDLTLTGEFQFLFKDEKGKINISFSSNHGEKSKNNLRFMIKYIERNINGYNKCKNTILTVIMIWTFRDTVLKNLTKDILLLICKNVWEDRYNKCWYDEVKL